VNGRSDETLSKKAKNGRAVANLRFVSREERQPKPMRRGETARKTPETASQHASRRHWDDNDDDPGPRVA